MIDQTSLLNYVNKRFEFNNRERVVYDALCELGEATSHEIMEHLGVLNPNFVRPRLSDLYKKGLKQNYPVVEKVRQISINGVTQWTWRVIS